MNRIVWLGRKALRWASRRLGVHFVAALPGSSDRAVKANETEKFFYLDSETTAELNWGEILVRNDRRLALRITYFDSIRSHPIVAGEDTLLSLELCAIGDNKHEGASLVVSFHPESGGENELMRIDPAMLVEMRNPVLYSISLMGLANIRGTFGIHLTHPGEVLNHIEISILEFAVADTELLQLLRARSHKSWRLGNELQHFGSGVYDHAMYAHRNASSPPENRHKTPQSIALGALAYTEPATAKPFPHEIIERTLKEAEWARIKEGDDPYHYAHRLLGKLLPIQPPDFCARLSGRDKKEPIRLLSICSGTAAVELGIISASGANIEATFVDINQSLIEQAIGRLPENCTGQCIIGNVNDIWPLPMRYDIVVCVSGLHHIVELEKTLDGIRDCLNPDGEFWVIGEQVGRNGNRLWPDAYEACNQVMSTIPPHYRINTYSGSVDEKIPNNNFGSASFEGIRSEEIEGLIDRYFLPISEYRRNAFLWRLVNQTYSNNYNLQKEDDVQTLQRLVIAEVECWWRGGRPTELFGVYTPRRLMIEGIPSV